MGLSSFFKRDKKEEKDETHIKINADNCIGCEKCVIACPNNVLILNDNVSSISNALSCKRCRVCMAICPNTCIEIN